MKNILVLGYFGFFTNQLDGQTIKTREFFDLLKRNAQSCAISYFDTQTFQYSKNSIFCLLKQIILADTICYLPGKKNLRYLFPIIYYLSRVFKINIIYPVVGGWLSEYLLDQPFFVEKLKRIKVLLVESVSLQRKLYLNYGFINVEVFPNFRLCEFKPLFKVTAKLKLVFMARIMKEKGVDYILDFASYCIKNSLDKNITIAFYGPINPSFKREFLSSISCFNFVEYKGIINYFNVYAELNKYDVLLLPTYYEGEGFPGSIIDAYKSGIPVIISKWKDLPEFVENGKTGFIFDLSSKEDMYNAILELSKDSDLLFQMKNNAYLKSFEYSSERAWNILQKYIYL